MKSLAIKTVAVAIAVVASGLAISHQIQVEKEAYNADLDAIITKECLRQLKAGHEVASPCLKYLQ